MRRAGWRRTRMTSGLGRGAAESAAAAARRKGDRCLPTRACWTSAEASTRWMAGAGSRSERRPARSAGDRVRQASRRAVPDSAATPMPEPDAGPKEEERARPARQQRRRLTCRSRQARGRLRPTRSRSPATGSGRPSSTSAHGPPCRTRWTAGRSRAAGSYAGAP